MASNIHSDTPTGVELSDSVFFCGVDGVQVRTAPKQGAGTVAIEFTVGYLVEALPPLEDYREQLLKDIVGAALTGSLQCIPGSALFVDNVTLPVTVNTTILDEPCFPEENLLNSCLRLLSTFQVYVEDDLDTELARFLGYVQLQREMDGGTIADHLSGVDRLEYMTPLPLLPPATTGGNGNETTATGLQGDTSNVSVTPWVLGVGALAGEYKFSYWKHYDKLASDTASFVRYRYHRITRVFGLEARPVYSTRPSSYGRGRRDATIFDSARVVGQMISFQVELSLARYLQVISPHKYVETSAYVDCAWGLQWWQ